MPLPADPSILIVVLTFVAGFAAVLVVALPFLARDQRSARMKVVAQRRQELSQQQRDDMAKSRARMRPQAHVDFMKRTLERIKLTSLTASTETRQLLVMAGWRHQQAVVTFVFARLAAAIGGAFLAFLMVAAQKKYNLGILLQLLIAAGAGGIGFMLPLILVKNAIAKRQKEMQLNIPDTLDLMVICVEAGLSIEAAFSRVADEISENARVLSEEIGLMTAELAYLGDRRKAFINFADRTGLPAVKSLSTALAQADRYGTSMAVALKVLAQENRDERMSKAEKKAAALPAQLTVPMIVFFLPVLFMVILGPAIIQIVNR